MGEGQNGRNLGGSGVDSGVRHDSFDTPLCFAHRHRLDWPEYFSDLLSVFHSGNVFPVAEGVHPVLDLQLRSLTTSTRHAFASLSRRNGGRRHPNGGSTFGARHISLPPEWNPSHALS